ncbi:hypothetical protein C9I28_27045 [Pseudoduganella armeniaca]|uniref:eCIS core domain-containing protein n=2 Tax=Pseudoduganella armeniaca TaxID=2072590 RepID=A0A2R4CIX4_9BURK|nr:hypothetical protein C9I28_27045 [Pseudoduganella armeniaca]
MTQVRQRAADMADAQATPLRDYEPSGECEAPHLPRRLRLGIEKLTGFSMHGVNVHRNSSLPAQLQARAFARGNDIHLAPGEERLLPHEAWHLVQQMQGRVTGTMRVAGHAVNDDVGLEREADAMGALALSLGPPASTACRGSQQSDPVNSHSFSSGTSTAMAHGHDLVAQRTPEQALQDNGVTSDKQQEIQCIVANARHIYATYPVVTARSLSFQTLRGEIRQAVSSIVSLERAFIESWNMDVSSSDVAYLPLASPDYRPRAAKPVPNAGEMVSYLTQWQAKMLSEKSMTADKKFASVLPMILRSPELPPTVQVALKLMFTHTSNFVPVDMQGRDIRSVEHGQYSRTSMTPPRADNAELLRADAKAQYAGEGTTIPRGRTFQVINQPLHAALLSNARMTSNIANMTHYGDTDNERMTYSEYTSSAGSHTGSLGLIPNMHRTLEVGGSLASRQLPGDAQPVAWEPAPLVPDHWRPLIPTDKLQSSTDKNYHDFLLADRSALVAETAAEITRMYAGAHQGPSVVPVQSPTHASLILELHYPDGYSEASKLSEAQWRELLIKRFNAAAESADLHTRITHRASFGFPYPTASSVGGPVRIWPGLVPKEVFKHIVFTTLVGLSKVKTIPAVGEAAAKTLPEPFATVGMPPSAASSSSTAPTATLHVEALKTAVRYAQDVMGTAAAALGPEELVGWIRDRLRKNLIKAKSGLADATLASPGGDHGYVKIASVIENLMEYSYLLEAVLHKPALPDDVYPQHFRRTLDLDNGPTQHATFYLDSGMQALVCAHMVARAWLERLGDGDRKNIFDGRTLRTVDLNSYFEYASIDGVNLLMAAMNRGSDGSYTAQPELLKLLRKRTPGIVSADLNPVLTSLNSKKTLVPPKVVFGQLAGPGETRNGITVPIVDITNASLDAVKSLNLQAGYANFFVAESLSKHQQLGADKFTMGRLNAVGTEAFVRLARAMIEPIAKFAAHPLPAAYRQRMDRIFYGDPPDTSDEIMDDASSSPSQGRVPNGMDWPVATANNLMSMDDDGESQVHLPPFPTSGSVTHVPSAYPATSSVLPYGQYASTFPVWHTANGYSFETGGTSSVRPSPLLSSSQPGLGGTERTSAPIRRQAARSRALHPYHRPGSGQVAPGPDSDSAQESSNSAQPSVPSNSSEDGMDF